MMMNFFLWVVTHCAAFAAQSEMSSLVNQALSPDTNVSKPAIEALREMGPDGLKALCDANPELLSKPWGSGVPFSTSAEAAAKRARLVVAVEKIAAQKDADLAQLYWFTDFEKAKAYAKSTGKPILSLRMLGNLNEERSCANSRFFRTVLYPNAEISQYLRDNFVLHWQSVRPVPQITIDFGNGRKLETTITGNSLHYVLDSRGGLIDVLPGLYSPQRFLESLQRVQKLPTENLQNYHRQRFAELSAEFAANAASLQLETTALLGLPRTSAKPTATEASGMAVSKSVGELRTLRRMNSEKKTASVPTNDNEWKRMAELHAEEVCLDENSLAIIRRKMLLNPVSSSSYQEQVQKYMNTVVPAFTFSIALDTVKNEFLLHRRIQEWFIDGNIPGNLDQLTEKIYSELFLTPSSDLWLGLLSPESYTALPNFGIVVDHEQK